jgi:hypothetical protein
MKGYRVYFMWLILLPLSLFIIWHLYINFTHYYNRKHLWEIPATKPAKTSYFHMPAL